MKFGYVSDDAVLDRIDFALPPDDRGNQKVLASGSRPPHPQIYVGCAEYRVKEWKGLLYPDKTSEGAMLSLYAQQFRVAEMNGTHYRIYPPEQIRGWAEQAANSSFLFLPKFPQMISHERHGFEELQTTTAAFIESVQAFGTNLGPLFLQMSEYYRPDTRKDLFAYLASLPEGFTYFLELRHPEWFTDGAIRQELLTALRALGIGLVITDTPGHREICHMALTIPRVMVRFVGRHRHPTTGLRADAWIERLRSWADMGLEAAYFITHTGFSAPLTAADTIRKMNEVIGTDIPVPKLISGGGTDTSK
jgi:uncharacterized protein YecE (DUF72 family)